MSINSLKAPGVVIPTISVSVDMYLYRPTNIQFISEQGSRLVWFDLVVMDGCRLLVYTSISSSVVYIN